MQFFRFFLKTDGFFQDEKDEKKKDEKKKGKENGPEAYFFVVVFVVGKLSTPKNQECRACCVEKSSHQAHAPYPL